MGSFESGLSPDEASRDLKAQAGCDARLDTASNNLKMLNQQSNFPGEIISGHRLIGGLKLIISD